MLYMPVLHIYIFMLVRYLHLDTHIQARKRVQLAGQLRCNGIWVMVVGVVSVVAAALYQIAWLTPVQPAQAPSRMPRAAPGGVYGRLM